MNHFQILSQNIKKRYNNKLGVLLLIPTVLSSGYPLTTVQGNKNYIIILLSTILMFLYYYLILGIKIDGKLKMSTLFCYVLIFGIIISSLMNEFQIRSSIRLIMIILYSYLFTNLIEFKTFTKYYTKILKWLTLISLIVFTGVNYFNIKLNLPIFENVNGATYYNGLVFFLFKKYGTNRNLGIFWEPGLFASFLIIGIILESLKKRKSKINILIYCIGIISTKSTFAFFIGILLIGYFIIMRLKKINKIIILIISISSYFIIIKRKVEILLKLNEIFPLVFGKILKKSNSITERIESPLQNLKFFFENPIFGKGVDFVEKAYSTILTTPQTSTSTFFLGTLGFIGILYTVMIIYGVLNLKTIDIISRMILLIIILIIVNKEPHINLTLTYIFIFYLCRKESCD